ncbi:hypothetical protein AOQ88_00320 [Candidatus Riesia sp. GBBU]|nr:hypothetical protein AOQ88_00320 [Candidatus Riesia sp. GBBU]
MSIKICIPEIGIEKVEVVDILVKIGEKVNTQQPIILVEGEKVSIEIPSPKSGIVEAIKVKKGDMVKQGSHIMSFFEEDKSEKTIIKNYKVDCEKEINNKKNYLESEEYFHATPIVRRLSRKFGVNLKYVSGTGRKNRILIEDVQNYILKAVEKFNPNNNNLISTEKDISIKKVSNRKIKLSNIQKVSGRNIKNSWKNIPHVTIMEEADITELELFRKKQNKEMQNLGKNLKITNLVFIIKLVAKILEKMPKFNSFITESNELVLNQDINIGIAVNTKNGILVPVIKKVDTKGVMKISEELMEISEKSRKFLIKPSSLTGGGFTISNLGGIGSKFFTPIINFPEVAILGLSRSYSKPIWNGKKFIPRLVLPMSLSFDHRVIDGVDGTKFLQLIKFVLNDIRQLIM